MKKILLTACAALMCVFANAQTIHWLTFIDTTDPNVGRIDVYGRQIIKVAPIGINGGIGAGSESGELPVSFGI